MAQEGKRATQDKPVVSSRKVFVLLLRAVGEMTGARCLTGNDEL